MMQPTANAFEIQPLQSSLFIEKNITVAVGRADLIHPEVSGNKIFKLKYFAEECMKHEHRTILTFGGAWSNHLVATAWFCQANGLRSIGIVRGEEPKNLSATLLRCKAYGMQLDFISRKEYAESNSPTFNEMLKNKYGEFTLIPEGGFGVQGAKGASLMYDHIKGFQPTHILLAVGTATTLAGILQASSTETIVAVPVIKNMADIRERLNEMNVDMSGKKLIIQADYHLGGYAKSNELLFEFMNAFYHEFRIPTDHVYTAKLFYALFDMIKKDFFPAGSRIICIHTGGLQGNRSLTPGTLIF